ncbi:MAG TPA: SCO family protein [Stellaceae bacterium]|jgi:protein SCO1/2|nr:SCO family protein [Stellaceae bacterium]
MSNAARRGLIIFLAGLAVLLGALVVEYLYLNAPGSGLAELAAPAGVSVGGPFTLTDQNGATRRPEDFRGRLMLIYFGYTYCPDVCPTELQTMSEAIDRLGAKGDAVQPIFITVDPARDTPEQLKSYAENFHPRLLALTGSAEQIAEAARAYKVFYQPVKQGDGEYLMDHSSIVYLMDRDGHYLAHFGGNLTAEQMAATIAKHL